MRALKIIFGILLVAFAILMILDAVGVLTPLTSIIGEITFWQITAGFFLLCAAVWLIATGHFWQIFLLLGFLFMLFERNIAFACGLDNENIVNNWMVFGCSLCFCIGFLLLSPSKKRKRKNHFHATAAGERCNTMSSSQVYIDCAVFEEESVENNLGALEIRFENVDEYRGGGILHIKNNLGAIELYVPKHWRIENDISNSLGAVDIESEVGTDPNAPLILITGSNNLGAIDIERT